LAQVNACSAAADAAAEMRQGTRSRGNHRASEMGNHADKFRWFMLTGMNGGIVLHCYDDDVHA